MSDINQSVPVRTDNPGEVQVKVVDNLVPSQGLTINVDGSVNITDNGASLTVDAVDLDIRNLSAAQDNVAISDGVDTLAINVDGSINSVVTATDLDIRDLTFATDKVDVSGSDVTVSNTVTVASTDLDIRDLTHVSDSVKIGDGTDFLAVNADGSVNVRILDSTPGTAVADFSTSAALAASATATHTYTATGNFRLTQVEASGSGSLKVVVKVNAVTKFVLFTSAAARNAHLTLSQELPITSGQTIVVELTNLDNKPFDVYSTVMGYNE